MSEKEKTNGQPMDTDGFWRKPREQHFAPPFPTAGYEIPSEKTVDDFCGFLKPCGFEPKLFDLKFRYHNALIPAVQEHRMVVATAATEAEFLRMQLDKLRAQRHAASEEFASAMARAGLPLDTSVHRHEHRQEKSIDVSRVEEALEQDCARPEEIAGRYGIEPPESSGSWLSKLSHYILPIAVGVIFGINLAVLTGFVDLDRLSRGEGLIYAVIGIIAGIAIEAAAGACSSGIARVLAQSTEPTHSDEGDFPRHKVTWWLLGPLLFALLLIAVGIVVVDALGLKTLHEDLLRSKLAENINEALQPLWVYFIAGAIISLPYLLFKFLHSWLSSSAHLRSARIELLAQRYLSERRKDSAVCEAFVAAQRVQNLQEDEQCLQQQIAQLEDRHDAARTAACTEAQSFRSLWDELVRSLSQTREPHISSSPPTPLGKQEDNGPYLT